MQANIFNSISKNIIQIKTKQKPSLYFQLTFLPIFLFIQLDTVCRVLLDRKWTVSELASATLIHAKDTIDYEETNDPTVKKYQRCFFEKLIGI